MQFNLTITMFANPFKNYIKMFYDVITIFFFCVADLASSSSSGCLNADLGVRCAAIFRYPHMLNLFIVVFTVLFLLIIVPFFLKLFCFLIYKMPELNAVNLPVKLCFTVPSLT